MVSHNSCVVWQSKVVREWVVKVVYVNLLSWKIIFGMLLHDP